MYLFKLEILSFLDKCPGVGLLDHMVTLFLVFCKESLYCFSIVPASILIDLRNIISWRCISITFE